MPHFDPKRKYKKKQLINDPTENTSIAMDGEATQKSSLATLRN